MRTIEQCGGPAFPFTVEECPGMTLRDWFAGLAMHSLCCEKEFKMFVHKNGKDVRGSIAMAAYEYADAMLQERAK